MFAKRQGEEKQQEFWIERTRVSKPPSQGFYSKLNEHLETMDFARQVWALCEPAYREESRGGRPGIDPVVYFKMLMVGFFENLRSERAIAAHCEDSLSVRAFLGYGLEERTPDHSSLSVIRQRLGPEIYQGVFEVVHEVSLLTSLCNVPTCSRRNSENLGAKGRTAGMGIHARMVRPGKSQRHPASQAMAQTRLPHAKGVLSYYKTGLTSGKMEGINRKIRGLLASAFGFRDHDFLKLRLYALMKPNSNLSAKTDFRESVLQQSASQPGR